MNYKEVKRDIQKRITRFLDTFISLAPAHGSLIIERLQLPVHLSLFRGTQKKWVWKLIVFLHQRRNSWNWSVDSLERHMITIITTIRLRARETPRRRWKCDADEARCRYKSIMMIIGRALNFCFSRVSSSTSTGGNFASIAHLSIKQGMESVDGWRRVKVMGNLWCWNGVRTSPHSKFKLPPVNHCLATF